MITVDLLRHVPLFASLPASELETLAARGADIRSMAIAFVHQYMA